VRRVAYIFAVVFCVGCSSTKTVVIKSDHPARIEVNEFVSCETTPCKVELRCEKPLGPESKFRIRATPVGDTSRMPASMDISQDYKYVDACELPNDSEINFNLYYKKDRGQPVIRIEEN